MDSAWEAQLLFNTRLLYCSICSLFKCNSSNVKLSDNLWKSFQPNVVERLSLKRHYVGFSLVCTGDDSGLFASAVNSSGDGRRNVISTRSNLTTKSPDLGSESLLGNCRWMSVKCLKSSVCRKVDFGESLPALTLWDCGSGWLPPQSVSIWLKKNGYF